jgi:hypothetical protein
VIGLAEGEARDILGSAGISLEFVLGPRRGGSDRGRDRGTSGCAIQAGSLKFATLGTNASTRIEILYNPIREFGRYDATGHVLAHVLVHEITHVLEGIARHSASGIMKARWEGADYERIYFAPLPFAGEDLRLIHAWWARHHQLAAVVR